jgi:tricorn protease
MLLRDPLRALSLLAAALLTATAGTSGAATAETSNPSSSTSTLGYYRFPSLRGGTIVFTAEGDLWRVPLAGGVAQRLTSHLGEESRAAISPDGRTVAFSATYDGPTEVYVMPLAGGLPKRLTWDGLRDLVVGWTDWNEVLFTSRRGSGLPAGQLFAVNPETGASHAIPLSQAAEGAWYGPTLYFTRQEPNISNTRRYRGGTIQQLWTWSNTVVVGEDPRSKYEARRLMPDDSSASRTPMPWRDRIYFVGDRTGSMNVWSVRPDGRDARQLTKHDGWDVLGASLDDGKIVYQLGADLRVVDVASGEDKALDIRLASDLDQSREHWVQNPTDWVTSAHLSPTGDRVALTARGQVFVVPVEDGRLVSVTREPGVRWRQARFLPDGRSLVALGDHARAPAGAAGRGTPGAGAGASGRGTPGAGGEAAGAGLPEVEWWKLPANGVGEPAAMTRDAKVLRLDGLPSPDGKWLASTNKDQELWLLDVAGGQHKRIAVSDEWDDPRDLAWSPDSRWLAYIRPAPNLLTQVMLYDTKSGATTALTSERWDSYSPAWSPDGKWLWFLSDRHFDTVVRSIWGSRQPDPFFDRPTQVFGLALQKGTRSPWAKLDELQPAGDEGKDRVSKAKDAKQPAAKAGDAKSPAPVSIDLDGLSSRLIEVPVDPGNLRALSTDGKRLYFLANESDVGAKPDLQSLEIARKQDGVSTVLAAVDSYELSADTKKLLVRKGDAWYVFDAGAKAPDKLDKSKLPLAGWTFAFDPKIEWRQMFTEAWRLERDYFYDRGMHGVNWKAQLEKFRPLADRVTTRAELADVFQQMVGELSALHMYVYGGDQRRGTDQAEPASLGARLERDERAGGWKVSRVFRTDPDEPSKLSPLAKPDVDVRDGDVVLAVNGVPTLSVSDPGALLRGQAGKQVLLRVQRAGGTAREVIAQPVTPARETDLRYTEWEYTRRLRVDTLSAGRVGYVHLRAMGAPDMAQWQRDYFPVYDRDGLVIDLRGNRGGNIDAWILGKLLRRAWFWWQPRTGHAFANMPFAFRGKIVALVNETTISDGEAFAEGFRRLGLGRVVGTRTWGGEIWLSQDNFLVDRGIATAAETGVFGPAGDWLIEGRGVEPDVVVDNLPRATADGADAQLDAAVRILLDEIKADPVKRPGTPRYPDKSGRR